MMPCCGARPVLLLCLSSLCALTTLRPSLGQAETNATGGFEDCPCLPVGTIKPVTNSSSCLASLSSETGDSCLPMDYGQGECRAWDSSRLQLCKYNDPLIDIWECTAQWCYVDTNHCTRPHKKANKIAGLADLPADLSYSYATCGYVDTSHTRFLEQGLSGSTLRVTWPGDSSIFLSTQSNGQKAGATAALLRFLANKHNFSFVEVDIPNVSHTMHPESSYTACVHAVAINSTDLCVGAVWVLPYRAAMTSFAESFQEESLYLITKRSTKQPLSIGDMLKRPFLPFSWQVWMLLVVTVFVSTFAHAWLEDFRLDPSAPRVPDARPRLHRFLASFYFMFHSFFSGASKARSPPLPSSPAAQILHTGFSFFLLVVISSYTANLVSFLVASRTPDAAIVSLQDAIMKGARVCGPAALTNQVTALYPELTSLYVPRVTDPAVTLLDDIDSGICAAAIDSEISFNSMLNPNHCDKILLPTVVISFNLAWPVRPDLEMLISAATANAVQAGNYKALLDSAKALLLPANPCSWQPESTDSDGYRLQLEDLAGIVIIYLLCLLGAVTVGAIRQATQSKTVQEGVEKSFRSLKGLASSNRSTPRERIDSGAEASNMEPSERL